MNQWVVLRIGQSIACARCGASTEVRGGLQKFCAGCSAKLARERNKQYEAAKRRVAGAKEIGASAVCLKCYSEYRRTNGQQKYCEPCGDDVRKVHHRAANKRYEKSRPPRVRDPVEAAERHRRHEARYPDRGRQRSSKYNERNRSLINRKSREFRQTLHRKEWSRKWEEKRRLDPVFSLNQRMRVAVRRALKGKKAGRSWKTILGYSVDELAQHLERQFLPDMTWQNIGRWHVDHILPLTSFDYQSEDDAAFLAAWSLTNLRPLWGVDNCSKGARRLHLI